MDRITIPLLTVPDPGMRMVLARLRKQINAVADQVNNLGGEPGSQGIQGDPGVDGEDGVDGYTPIKGVDYFDGDQGEPGEPGATGDPGEPGAAGPEGDPGDQGIQGIQGIPGDPGAAGAKGDQGDPGAGCAVVLKPAAGIYVGNLMSGTLTTLASAANRMDIAPFRSEFGLTIDTVGLSVSTASAGNACVVIYDADSDGRPTTILAQSGNMDTGTTGTKTTALNFTFTAGKRYWVGRWTSAAPTLRCGQTYVSTPLSWTTAATPVRQHVLRRVLAYGTADNWTYASGNHVSANAPLVLLRVA